MSSYSEEEESQPVYEPDEQSLSTIKDLEAKKEKLVRALNQCEKDSDVSPYSQISQIINRIDHTIEKLKSEPVILRHYYVRFAIPKMSTLRPLKVNVRIDQMLDSLPLGLNYFIVVKPPIGDAISMPRVTSKMTQVNYTCSFQFPDRTQKYVSMAKAN